MAWPLNLLERFVWKALPVVVWICTQPWPLNSSRTKKIVWGTCVKGFNWPCFRHKANRTVNISWHLEVSSKEWWSDRENASARAVLTPKLFGHTQDLCSVRCETCTKCCCCGSVDSFDARSVTNRKLVPSSFHRASLNIVMFRLAAKPAGRAARRAHPPMKTSTVAHALNVDLPDFQRPKLSQFWIVFFFYKKRPLRLGWRKTFQSIFDLANPTLKNDANVPTGSLSVETKITTMQSCMLQRSKVSVVTAYRDVTVYRAWLSYRELHIASAFSQLINTRAFIVYLNWLRVQQEVAYFLKRKDTTVKVLLSVL